MYLRADRRSHEIIIFEWLKRKPSKSTFENTFLGRINLIMGTIISIHWVHEQRKTSDEYEWHEPWAPWLGFRWGLLCCRPCLYIAPRHGDVRLHTKKSKAKKEERKIWFFFFPLFFSLYLCCWQRESLAWYGEIFIIIFF